MQHASTVWWQPYLVSVFTATGRVNSKHIQNADTWAVKVCSSEDLFL